jgi:hypothetical protein
MLRGIFQERSASNRIGSNACALQVKATEKEFSHQVAGGRLLGQE